MQKQKQKEQKLKDDCEFIDAVIKYVRKRVYGKVREHHRKEDFLWNT